MYHRGTRQTPACTHVANYVLIKKRSTVMAAPVYTDTPPPPKRLIAKSLRGPSHVCTYARADFEH